MLTAQYQGSCWHCFPSKRQKRNSSRKGSAQLVKVHKVFSFQDEVEVTGLGRGALFDLNYLAGIWLDIDLLPREGSSVGVPDGHFLSVYHVHVTIFS